MVMKKYYFIALILFFGLLSCSKEETKTQAQVASRPSIPILDNRPRDIDGNVYSVVAIGTQKWLRSNLNVSHYRNGDPIPQVPNTQWGNLTTGAWCYYNNDPANGPIYGKLYNWYAVNDPRGLAQAGWHISSNAEFTTLGNYLGGSTVAGGKMKVTSCLNNSNALWYCPNYYATNTSGFTAVGAGCVAAISGGEFANKGSQGYWWTASQDSAGNAWVYFTYYSVGSLSVYSSSKANGFSVRCLKDY